MKSIDLIRYHVIALILLSASGVTAQKIGYIDSERIFREFDEFRLAQQKFDEEARAAEADIQKAWSDLDSLQQAFEKGRFIWSDTRIAEKREEIEKKRDEIKEITESTFGPGGRIYTVQKELTERAMEDIILALRAVVEDEDYEMIFDAARGLLPFKKEEYDLTDKVLDELRKGQVTAPGRK